MNEQPPSDSDPKPTNSHADHDPSAAHEPAIDETDELQDAYDDEDNFEDDEFDDDEFENSDELDQELIEEELASDRARSLMDELFDELDVAEQMSDLDVLTLEEAADYLQLEEGDVRRLVKDQGLPARKIGDEWRFLRGAIADWLRGVTPAPSQPEREGRPDRREFRRQDDQGSRYPRQGNRYPQGEGSRYPQQDRPRRPRYSSEQQNFQEGEAQGGYPPPRRGRHAEGQQSQGEYRRPRRPPFNGGPGQGFNNESGGQFGGGHSGGRRTGGPKKPKRKALNEQRFKRLDRRKFGNDSGQDTPGDEG